MYRGPPLVLSNANTLIPMRDNAKIYRMSLTLENAGRVDKNLNQTCFPLNGVEIIGYNIDHDVSIESKS